ncbi:MAG TPA: hypothetical protein VFY12_09615 [Arenimonas sp.]|nr:hypothetical protein [Arenimonas sp.]
MTALLWRWPWLLLLLGASAQAAELRLERGEARDPDSGELLYIEQHLLRLDAGSPMQRLVLYRCPDGTAFARKTVDYRQSRQAPEFSFEDVRIGYREGLRRSPEPELWFADRAPPRRTPINDAALVADAGFDEFVRLNWPALLAGDALRFAFAVPARQRSYGFALRRVGDRVIGDAPAAHLRLQFDGWLGRWLPSVDLFYSHQSRRLLRFEGLSNLRSDAGDRQLRARIDFPHPAQPVSADAWQSAVDEPLRSCRMQDPPPA